MTSLETLFVNVLLVISLLLVFAYIVYKVITAKKSREPVHIILTEEQREIIRDGRVDELSWHDLTPAQRQKIKGWFLRHYFSHPDVYSMTVKEIDSGLWWEQWTPEERLVWLGVKEAEPPASWK